jgi:hypothetical protein
MFESSPFVKGDLEEIFRGVDDSEACKIPPNPLYERGGYER